MAEDHVISGLVAKRAKMAGDVRSAQLHVIRLKQDLAHVDAVIRILRPNYDVSTIRPRATFRRNPMGLARGAGSRSALDVLREAGEGLTSREIATRILGRTGRAVTVEAVRSLSSTVHSSLSRRKDGAVRFDATQQPGRWILSQAGDKT